jgi:predicted metal-binding membrane protein
VYGEVPPVTVTFIDPSAAALHVTFAEVFEAANAAGSVIVALVVVVHPFASVTVKIYVPGVKSDKSSVVLAEASSHKYVYGEVPPVTVASIVPSAAPLHVTFTEVFVAANAAGSVIVALVVVEQLLASVTVKV